MYPEDNLDRATEIREAIQEIDTPPYNLVTNRLLKTITRAALEYAELLEVRAILYLIPGQLIGPYLKAIRIPVERG